MLRIGSGCFRIITNMAKRDNRKLIIKIVIGVATLVLVASSILPFFLYANIF